jgi:hypothetical protein
MARSQNDVESRISHDCTEADFQAGDSLEAPSLGCFFEGDASSSPSEADRFLPLLNQDIIKLELALVDSFFFLIGT